MAASDHLSGEQYVTLYRGLRNATHPDELNLDAIGPHWTPDREAAERFARGHLSTGESERDRYGSVLTAQIHRRNLLSDYAKQETYPGFEDYAMGNDSIHAALRPWSSESDYEKESFVRPNRRVHITSMETIANSPIQDKWEFDTPLKANSRKDYAVDVHDGEITKWHQGSN